MKLIVAIIRPDRLNEVLEALYRADVPGLTVSRVLGHGGETDRVETYRGTTVKMELQEKVRLEIGVSEPFVDITVECHPRRRPDGRGRRWQGLRPRRGAGAPHSHRRAGRAGGDAAGADRRPSDTRSRRSSKDRRGHAFGMPPFARAVDHGPRVTPPLEQGISTPRSGACPATPGRPPMPMEYDHEFIPAARVPSCQGTAAAAPRRYLRVRDQQDRGRLERATDGQLEFRPHARSSSVRQILVHQLLSERRFFAEFLGLAEPAGSRCFRRRGRRAGRPTSTA